MPGNLSIELSDPGFQVLGIMSGTSLDGIDLALCRFTKETESGGWNFSITVAETREYSLSWRERLSGARLLDGESLTRLDREYGILLADVVQDFLKNSGSIAGLIASHGHTVFHQPEKGYTLQIGSGPVIAARTGIPVVYDFRSADVALGGQGAPLVPVGDHYLFADFDACLNLGGFANISFVESGQRQAFDICPVNIVLNRLARELGMEYDAEGKMAESGKVSDKLLADLDALEFYKQKGPKSLGEEWVLEAVLPHLRESKLTTVDQLATFTAHAAQQIAGIISDTRAGQVLVTGGGGYNTFLLKQIEKRTNAVLTLPGPKIIDYKEALIFAFLGLLNIRGENNCFGSVTGAERDSVCGVLCQAYKK